MVGTRAIIFDIDGTLADNEHRVHHVRAPAKNWDAYEAEMPKDTIVGPIRELLWILTERGDKIIITTGRQEKNRPETEAWLAMHGVNYDKLYMRGTDDLRADRLIKVDMLSAMREEGFEPWLAIDDRPSIIKVWREHGITALQCRDWNEFDRHGPNLALLTVMVGPSGAGKSSWLHGRADIDPSHIVSSDQIRADLCGDFRDQSRNAEVFDALHDVVKSRLSHNLPVYVDATNLRTKDRLAVVSLNSGGPVRYIVIDRPMDEKVRDAGWRADIKAPSGEPFDLLARHAQIFRSNLKAILAGDGLPNVTVIDVRPKPPPTRKQRNAAMLAAGTGAAE